MRSTRGAAGSGAELGGADCGCAEVAGEAQLDAEAPEAARKDGDAATAPGRGRDDADDADGAGGRGEETGEGAGDPRATPSTAAAARATTAP